MPEITNVGTNIAEKSTVIWNVADMLRGPFKPHEYGLVILPMTVIKRFHDCLLPTHEQVLEQYEKVKAKQQQMENDKEKIEEVITSFKYCKEKKYKDLYKENKELER